MNRLRLTHLGLALGLAFGVAQIGAGCGDDTGGSGSTGPGAGGGAEGVCGDNLLDDDLGEECDDGDFDDTDDCKSDCTLGYCGDGVVHLGAEDCDDGNEGDGDKCSNDCVANVPGCGNGIPEEGEECDDGNAIDDDACNRSCAAARCGDGVVHEGETCDDGNTEDTDACSNACASGEGCGNGTTESPEQCDDGNTSNADECLADCTEAYCGDGFARATVEACDDGNGNDGDFCKNDCTVNEGVEYGCPGAPISLGEGADSYELSTADAEHEHGGSCDGGSASPEIAFEVTPAVDGTLYVRLTGDVSFDTVLYARTGSCDGGTEVACADFAPQGGIEEITLDVLAAEPIWVFADGYGDGATGTFVIDFELVGEVVPVEGDTCPGVDIQIGAFDQIDLSGDTTAAADDYVGDGVCDAGTGPDIVYMITPSADGIIHAYIAADFDVMLYDFIECGDSSTMISCGDDPASQGDETIDLPAYVGETHYLVVDGYDGASGTFELTLSLDPD